MPTNRTDVGNNDPGSDRATQSAGRIPAGRVEAAGSQASRQGLTRRQELGAFLRARRAGLRPVDVGLPEGAFPGRRRTPGLRREEVAELSGVGVTWYTWLEQGRNIPASEQVVDALARALRLDHDEYHHLRDLAGLQSSPNSAPRDEVVPRVQRMVDALSPNVASVYDLHFDYLAWNTPYVVVRHDPARFPPDRRNLAWMMFTDQENRARMLRWEPAARAVLGQFRAVAGQHPGDPRFVEIVAALKQASPDFGTWWEQYPIRYFKPATIGIMHPEVGQIDFDMFQARLVEYPGLLLVTQIPVGDSRSKVEALLDRRHL